MNLLDSKPIPTEDCFGHPINQNGYPSYVRVISDLDTPILMRSWNHSAAMAEVWNIPMCRWIPSPLAWHEYVNEGRYGVDYEYVDDIYAEDAISSIYGKRVGI